MNRRGQKQQPVCSRSPAATHSTQHTGGETGVEPYIASARGEGETPRVSSLYSPEEGARVHGVLAKPTCRPRRRAPKVSKLNPEWVLTKSGGKRVGEFWPLPPGAPSWEVGEGCRPLVLISAPPPTPHPPGQKLPTTPGPLVGLCFSSDETLLGTT